LRLVGSDPISALFALSRYVSLLRVMGAENLEKWEKYMPIKLTPGKIAGLNAVSDSRGVIAALAMDQLGCSAHVGKGTGRQ